MNAGNEAEKQRFQKKMAPLWEEVMMMLAADRPPAWEGFRFEGRIQNQSQSGKFAIECKYGDRVSNRVRGGVQRKVLDKLARLHIAYLDFSPMMAWKVVTMEQIWKPESESWSFETRWEY